MPWRFRLCPRLLMLLLLLLLILLLLLVRLLLLLLLLRLQLLVLFMVLVGDIAADVDPGGGFVRGTACPGDTTGMRV